MLKAFNFLSLSVFCFSHCCFVIEFAPFRSCKWLPSDLKEGYLQTVKKVEKAVMRAVMALLSLFQCIWEYSSSIFIFHINKRHGVHCLAL